MITLYPHQTQAADQLEALLNQYSVAYLRGEVRTGKTLTAFEVVRRLGCVRVLLFTKKKAIPSIAADAESIGVNVTITNYEQAHKYAKQECDLLIVDEAHCVGAYPKPSKRWHDLRQIKATRLLLMSGTPSPESFSHLYHQLALSPASPWATHKNFYAWARAGYVNISQRYVGTSMPVNDYSDGVAARILPDLEPYTVEMTQKQAGFSQEIEERIHRVKMRPRTYRMARRISETGVIGRPDCRAVVADTGAKVMSKLRQMWGGTVITERHGAIAFDDSKAKYICDVFCGQKVAILYAFSAEGQMLRKVLEEDGIEVVDTPEAFNAGGRHCWYVGQVVASREGVNLSSADGLVMYGVDYSALSYLQGRDRASYRGRTKANVLHWILADRGLEQRVLNTVRSKEDFTIAHFRSEISGGTNQKVRTGRVVRAASNQGKRGRHP